MIFIYLYLNRPAIQMKKSLLLFSLISILAIACTSEKGEVPIPVQGCVVDSTVHVVNVTIKDDFSFDPKDITIVVGDTVKWTYPSTGTLSHTATCDGTNGSTLPSGGTTWDSGQLNPGVIYKKAIAIPGNYTYVCTYHAPMMSGTIVVKPRCK